LSWPPNAAQKAADRRTRQRVYVGRSPIHGWGLFARGHLERDAHIGTYLGPWAQRNGSHVLWVDTGEGWIGRRGFNRLRYVNHSKRPNAEFDGFDLYARRTIRPDEEITIDYGWDDD
jgi:SET domain-containing protein